LPDEPQYLQYFAIFAKAFGVFRRCAVVVTGRGPDEDALAALIEEGVTKQRKGDVLAVFDEMGRLHRTEPHWYLPLIGVEPRHPGARPWSGTPAAGSGEMRCAASTRLSRSDKLEEPTAL
jgi:hypothetical protein